MQKLTLIIKDPALVKKITIADFDSFHNHDNNVDLGIDNFFSKSMVSLGGSEWKDMRTIFNPIFTSSKLKYMYELLVECQEDFLKLLMEKAELNAGKIEVDTHDMFGRLTADGISTTILGIKGDCVKNQSSKLYEVAESMYEDFESLSATMYFVAPKVFKFFNLQMFRKSTEDFFETFVTNEVKRREQEKVSRPDSIDLMLKIRKCELKIETGDSQEYYYSESKIKRLANLTDKDFAPQALGFFLAGFESNTTLMQAISFELAINPDIQQTLIQEVDDMLAKLNGDKISYDQLNGMKFLEMVIKEALRKWPPGRGTTRICTKDYILIDDETGETYNIKKGTDIFIPILDIHKNPKYYKEPEKFNPYRFSEEGKTIVSDGMFLPFGMGPRRCLGDRFAMLEAKLIFFYILSKFSIKCSENTPKQLKIPLKLAGFDMKICLLFQMRK